MRVREKHGADKKRRYESYRFSIRESFMYTGIGLGTGIFIIWICYHSFYAIPLLPVITVGFIYYKRKELKEKRDITMLYHFRDFMASFHTALRAGYSVENAVRSSMQDLRQMYGTEDLLYLEVKEIVHQTELQLPVEKQFVEFGDRCGMEDIRSFGEILQIAKRTGGDLNTVLQNTRNTLCERIDTRQEIESLIASKKFELQIMNIMPALMILYMRVSFPGFMEELYGNLPGVCIMTLCLGVYLTAWMLGNRLVRIEV